MSSSKKHRQQDLSVVSLFTGAGGLDLGLEAAGFSIRLCVEVDSDCRNTISCNRPLWKFAVPGDIHKIKPDEILLQTGLKRGELALLTGGPPCQPFSKAAYWVSGDSARLTDARASTLTAYMTAVEGLLPQCILIENVLGLGYEGKSEGLNLLKRKLKAINKKNSVNYIPHVLCLNAADFGIPQLRQRLFIVAHREGRAFCLPAPTHCDHKKCNRKYCKLKRYSTAWDAIGHLDYPKWNDELNARGKWADLLPSIPEGKNYLWHTHKQEGESLFGWRTRYWSFLLKLAKHTPSWTIQAMPGPSTGPFHWRNRQLSIEELCRLQTFPKGYIVMGSRRSAIRQIGNAVPSALGELLGIAIRKQFFGKSGTTNRLSLIPGQAVSCPKPEQISHVPIKYLKLNGRHKDHPGVGRGPLASLR